MSNGLINTSALSHLDSASTVQVEEALSSHFLDAVKVPPEHCYLGMSKGKRLEVLHCVVRMSAILRCVFSIFLRLYIRDSTFL